MALRRYFQLVALRFLRLDEGEGNEIAVCQVVCSRGEGISKPPLATNGYPLPSLQPHSLVFILFNLRRAALKYLRERPGNVFLPDELRPSAVLVRIFLNKTQREAWLRDTPHLTRVPGDIVIPVEQKTEYVNLVSIFGTKLLAASITMPQYELGLIGTVHKCQGKTLARCIISLLKRYGNPVREDYHALYVALARIHQGVDFLILADKDDLQFVNNLRPPPELLAFMDGYDKHGVWNRQRALGSLASRQEASSAIVPSKRRTSSSAPPKTTKRTKMQK